MPLIDVARSDLARMPVDAVVAPAGPDLGPGAGPSGAVRRRAGPGVLEACRRLRETTLPHGLEVGHAVATPAGALAARWVIHAVGPRYSRAEDRSALLRATYRRCLLVADSVGARTVAFPLLAAGAGAWPTGDAIDQAVRALGEASCGVEVATLVTDDPSTARLMLAALA